MSAASGTDTGRAMRYWSAREVEDHVTLRAATEAVRATFLNGAEAGHEQPLRLALGGGRMLVMAARRHSDGNAVVKVVKVATDAASGGHTPMIDGTLLWVGGSGEPVWAADADILTVLRTAAMASLATDALAVRHAHRLTVLGAGEQAAAQVAAVALVRPVDEVTLWNRTRRRAELLAERLTATMPQARVSVADDPDDAVQGAHVVCCATGATEPLFSASSLGPEAHLNAVGSYRAAMREFPAELLGSASYVAVDDASACAVESGEIVEALERGLLHSGRLRDLTALLTARPVRQGQTVFKSVGTAVADLAVAELLASGTAHGAGTDAAPGRPGNV